MGKLKIGELSERVGITTTTLRYYERIGLMENTERGENGYRLYGEETINQLLFVKRAKQFGLSLEDASNRGTELFQSPLFIFCT